MWCSGQRLFVPSPFASSLGVCVLKGPQSKRRIMDKQVCVRAQRDLQAWHPGKCKRVRVSQQGVAVGAPPPGSVERGPVGKPPGPQVNSCDPKIRVCARGRCHSAASSHSGLSARRF